MEKITEQINKNSMNITVLQFTVAQQEDRLKTLEDKVKFIMENTDKEIFEQTGMQEADSKWVKLQDLWDEENEPTFEEMRIKNKEIADEMLKPTVNIPKKVRVVVGKKDNWGETLTAKDEDFKPTDKSEKIEEIIKEFEDKFILTTQTQYEKAILTAIKEDWLRDKLKEL